VRFWGLKSCDTCRKARKELEASGIEFCYIDIRADGIDHSDLEFFFKSFGDMMINKRSATWQGLSEEEKSEDPIDLASKYPTLLKRPVIENNGKRTFGWDAKTKSGWLDC
jgi:Spx/MgsR family transcriptional regulator